MKVIIVDNRRHFLDDINTRVLLNDMPFEIVATLQTPDKLFTAINKFAPDVVAVCDNVIDMDNDWHYEGTAVVGYATSSEGAEYITKAGIPSYGVVANSAHLINLLKGPVPTESRKAKEETAPPARQPKRAEPEPEEHLIDVDAIEAEAERRERENVQTPPERRLDTFDYRNVASDARDQPSAYSESVMTRKRREAMREERARKAVHEDFAHHKKEAIIVTVYAAKGGVG